MVDALPARYRNADAVSSRLVERIADAVAALIAERSLQPGMRLPGERDLGVRLGVSRAVLREAIRILEQRGIVDVQPARGIFVATRGYESVLRTLTERLREEEFDFGAFLEARQLLEVRVAELAAERRTEADLTGLRAALLGMRELIEAPQKFYDHDLEFHRLLAAASHNRLFPLWLHPIMENLFVNVQLQVLFKEIRHRILAGHTRILAAVETSDPAAAAAAMREHISEFAEDTRRARALDIF